VLPPKPEESVGGRGWTKDDVHQLEEFLGNKWGGAGAYEVTVMGSNGESMKWKPFFPESRYPSLHRGQPIEKPAPSQPMQMPLQGVANPMMPQNGSSWIGGMPAPMVAQQPSPWGAQQPAGSPWMGAAVHPGFQPPPQWRPQEQGVASQLQLEREARIKTENQMALDRIDASNKENLNSLAQQLEHMRRENATPKDSEEAKLLREELRQLKADRAEDKVAQMIADSNRQNREMMASMQAQNREMMAKMQEQISRAPAGPDPTMMVLVEAMKSNSAAQTEAARSAADAQKEIARYQAEAPEPTRACST
jgi:hypothetical protein